MTVNNFLRHPALEGDINRYRQAGYQIEPDVGEFAQVYQRICVLTQELLTGVASSHVKMLHLHILFSQIAEASAEIHISVGSASSLGNNPMVDDPASRKVCLVFNGIVTPQEPTGQEGFIKRCIQQEGSYYWFEEIGRKGKVIGIQGHQDWERGMQQAAQRGLMAVQDNHSPLLFPCQVDTHVLPDLVDTEEHGQRG